MNHWADLRMCKQRCCVGIYTPRFLICLYINSYQIVGQLSISDETLIK